MKHLVKRLGAAITALLLTSSGANSQETASSTTSSTTTCATILTPTYSPPVVAKGWKAQLVATGLTRPRGLKYDANGALLVVEDGVGITHLTFNDNGGTCLSVKSMTSLLTDPDGPDSSDLNHGIELSADGKTLYASTAEAVYSWDYNADAVTARYPVLLIQNMTNPGDGHVSRTLLLSSKHPDTLLVSRGSSSNIDRLAAQQSSGISQIRAFKISPVPSRPYDYPSSGDLIGWGLRNSVGVAEHPTTGTIYSVENSADNLSRDDVDIHEDNPGEELNAHGALPSPLAANHGYPACYALWNTTSFPELDNNNLAVGDQFSLTSNNDSACTNPKTYTPPRLTFTAHMAPLDLKFLSGSLALITFHGSWNRDHPAGYKLSYVTFNNKTGEPTESADSVTAVKDIMTAPDLGECGGRGEAKCFRPVGVAVDGERGRVFVSSDATGEIWVVMRTEEGEDEGGEGDEGEEGGGEGQNGNGNATETGTGQENAGTDGDTSAAARVVVGLTVVVAVVGGLGLVVG